MTSPPRGREPNDLQRSAGALLLATGALVTLFRSANAPHWTEFERVLVISLPVALLYGLAIGPRSAEEDSGPPDRAAPWRSVLLVTSVLLAPIALLAVLEWLSVDTSKWSVQELVFLATAALAAIGASLARASYGMFITGIALLISWLILWSKIIDHPSADDYRWFLLTGAVLLFAAAARNAASSRLGVGELAVAGGIAGVAAGSVGLVVGEIAGALEGFESGSFLVSSGHSSSLNANVAGLQHFGWDLYLLVLSLLLVWVGSRVKARGLGYVGGIGLFAFVISVGEQLTRLEHGHGPNHALLGWPIALVALGLLALLAPLVSSRRAAGRG